MALPVEIVTRTVTYGPETDFQGNSVTGTLTFTPSEPITWVASGQGLHVKPISVNLNSSGSGSIDLICTDQTGFRNAAGQNITGWWYTVTAELVGVASSTRKFVVPSGVGSLDLDTMIPITTGSTTISVPVIVNSVAGRTGAVTLTKNDVGLGSLDANETALRIAADAALNVKEISAADPQYGTPGTRAAFIAALDAAEVLGKHTVVRIPNGLQIDVLNGLSLSGYSVQIKGSSAGVSSTGSAACAIIASTQTGPVLDFTGYVTPYSFKGRVVPLCDITIQGSNVADATKVKCGLKFGSLGSSYIHDVAIMNTGGPCINMASVPGNAVYLNDFERIIMSTPVGANANDVPYFIADECNGNRFRGFGFRSLLSSADSGVSGVAVITSNATYRAANILLDSWWFENLHVPDGGTLLSFQGNGSTIRDFQFFDCYRDSGANNTSFIKLLPAPTGDGGGNTIEGVIPGYGTSTTIEIQTGVDIRQSWNSVHGIKGYRGNNVTLASGVGNTFVHLRGSVGSGSVIGWTDNSGTTTNHLIDDYMKTEVQPNGWKTNGITTSIGTGSPEGVVTGVVGDTYTQTDGTGGHIRFVKGTVSGNTGWRVVQLETYSAATLAGVSQSIGLSASNVTVYTLTANQTFTSVSGGRVGGMFVVIIKQDATGSRTVTWPATVKWAGNTAPTLSTAANAQDVFTFVYENAGLLREMSRSLGQT